MVRVSGSAVKAFIEQFLALTSCALPVAEAETVVERVRSTLGSRPVDDSKQVEVVSAALVLLKNLILQYDPQASQAWSLEEWSDALWALLEPATSLTLSGQSCSNVMCAEDRWEMAVQDSLKLRSEQVTDVYKHWWSHKAVVALVVLFLAYFISSVPGLLVEASAKNKFLAATVVSCMVLGIAGWLQWGPTYFRESRITGETVLSAEVNPRPVVEEAVDEDRQDVSVDLRKQLEDMKFELEKAKQSNMPPMPAPAFAPPLPGTGAVASDLPGDSSRQEQLDALRSFTLDKEAGGVKAKPKPTLAKTSATWKVGDVVKLQAVEGLPEVENELGTIQAVGDSFYEVKLSSGGVVSYLENQNLHKPGPLFKPSTELVYAPLSTGAATSVEQQAQEIRKSLEGFRAAAASDLFWASRFWASVAAIEHLHPALLAILQGHGFIGGGTVAAPRSEELIKVLRQFESTGHPRAGVAAAMFEEALAEAPPLNIDEAAALDTSKWHSRLAPDMNRAAPEIYRTIRASGAASLRDWVSDLFPYEQRTSQLFQAKFTDASLVDFKVAKCRDHQELLQLLSTDDSIEIVLRSLAAFVHHKRTGDSDASTSMLAIRAPGALTDIAPSWLVSDASQYAKSESQRKERGRKGGYSDGGKGGAGRSAGDSGKGGAGRPSAKGKAKAKAAAGPAAKA